MTVSQAHLPPGVMLEFQEHGSLEVAGDTLDLNRAEITASGTHRLFFGTAEIRGLALSRPEWFSSAPQGDEAYPAEATRLAVRALTPDGILQLSDAAYLSPFFDPRAPSPCSGTALSITTALRIQGTRRPVPDSETAPTRLQHGSILRGEICGTGELHVSHLGVDEGPFTVEHDFHGKPAFGIQLASTGTLGATHGTSLEDISVLTNGMQDQHSVIIEGQRDATIRDLWIWSRGGTHGLVIKSLHTIVDGFHCSGAAADCLILKADFATDRAGDASGSSVSQVDIHSLAHSGDTGGIELDGRWDSLTNISLNNVQERGVRYGIISDDSLFYGVSHLRVRNWKAADLTGPCLILNGSSDVSIGQFSCSSPQDPGTPLLVLHGSRTSLNEGSILCSGGDACERWTSDAIADQGRADRLNHITGSHLGGYLVGTAWRPSPDAMLATHNGNNQIWHRVLPSIYSEALAWFYLVKGAVRITLTHLSTRYGPLALPLCLALFGAAIVVALVAVRSLTAGQDRTGGGS